MQAQDGVVLEHPAGEVAPGLRLDLHMDENELRLSVAGFEPATTSASRALPSGTLAKTSLSTKRRVSKSRPGRGWASFLKKISAGFGTLVHPAIAVPNRPPKPGESEKKKRESADFRGRGDGQ